MFANVDQADAAEQLEKNSSSVLWEVGVFVVVVVALLIIVVAAHA